MPSTDPFQRLVNPYAQGGAADDSGRSAHAAGRALAVGALGLGAVGVFTGTGLADEGDAAGDTTGSSSQNATADAGDAEYVEPDFSDGIDSGIYVESESGDGIDREIYFESEFGDEIDPGIYREPGDPAQLFDGPTTYESAGDVPNVDEQLIAYTGAGVEDEADSESGGPSAAAEGPVGSAPVSLPEPVDVTYASDGRMDGGGPTSSTSGVALGRQGAFAQAGPVPARSGGDGRDGTIAAPPENLEGIAPGVDTQRQGDSRQRDIDYAENLANALGDVDLSQGNTLLISNTGHAIPEAEAAAAAGFQGRDAHRRCRPGHGQRSSAGGAAQHGPVAARGRLRPVPGPVHRHRGPPRHRRRRPVES